MRAARTAMAPAAAVVLLVTPAPAATPAHASAPAPARAVGEVLAPEAVARVAPRGRARALTVLRPLRADARPQVVLVVGAERDAHGRLWYRVRLPVRPNGTTGWIRATRLRVRPVRTRVEIDRSARTLTIRRGARVLMRTRVAVGAPGTETPVGHFYVTARFRPTLAYLGAYAFETNAFSRLSDWPGGGLIGLHGTDQPALIGRAVSHGCVRLDDRDIRRMRRMVPLGAPVRISP